MNRAHKNKHYITNTNPNIYRERPVILAAGRFLFGFVILWLIEHCPDVVNISISGGYLYT